MSDNTKRFSDRAADYARYRPDYPKGILEYLKVYNFSGGSTVADIGSGTGKLTKLFLENGNTVYAVEPNDNMRNTALALLSKYKNFISINGTAENTTLQNGSADFVVAAQAFHWFDVPKALNEFRRILKQDGVMALIWNTRKDDTLFMREYENLMQKYSSGYKGSSRKNISGGGMENYFRKDYKKISLENDQEFDFEGLMGRFSSSSYAPKNGTAEYSSACQALKEIFEKHNVNGKVIFGHYTEIFAGRI